LKIKAVFGIGNVWIFKINRKLSFGCYLNKPVGNDYRPATAYHYKLHAILIFLSNGNVQGKKLQNHMFGGKIKRMIKGIIYLDYKCSIAFFENGSKYLLTKLNVRSHDQ